ncbi:MAG: sigma-54-dependent Fis family transcriptional regulator [Calditrichaeota bacterium]|nr:MAG: sigma-54-dependent Fis family transcriptional regulator [Calditrichota bacterium]
MSKHSFPTYPVLLIDDEEEFLFSASLTLKSEGIENVLQCQDPRKVMDLLREQPVSVILLDMYMPHISGQDLLVEIMKEFPEIPVVVVTAVNEVETAVACMKEGAYEYIVKPITDERLVTTIRRAIRFSEMRSENLRLKRYLLSDELNHPEAFTAIITQNARMRATFKYIEAVAATFLPVLVTGETGTGKELIAKAIHELSGRSGELVAVNVGGVDDNMLSDTLFGHKKGAFTGAETDRSGLIEQAQGGTLFLDEIGDMSPDSQVKLLRLLQEGKYYPLGSDVPKKTDVRIIAATHQNLENMQNNAKFRRDLYFRLQAHHVHIPPLRDRKDDLPLLVYHFLEKAATSLKRKKPTPPRELFTLLGTYSFPGNIRELEGMIYDAVSLHKSGVLSMEAIREKVSQRSKTGIASTPGEVSLQHGLVQFSEKLPTMKDLENVLIEEALKRAHGNQTIAAEILGLSRRALNNRLKRAR